MKRKQRKTLRRRREHFFDNLATVGIIFVVLSLALVVGIRTSALKEEEMRLLQIETDLEEQIEYEQKRSEKLKEEAILVQTKQHIEKIAKEKLGLVHENEIIFKAGSNN